MHRPVDLKQTMHASPQPQLEPNSLCGGEEMIHLTGEEEPLHRRDDNEGKRGADGAALKLEQSFDKKQIHYLLKVDGRFRATNK